MSDASFWFIFSHAQLNGLKSAFKLSDCIWRANWNHILIHVTVLVIASKWKKNVRLVFVSVIWAQLLACACTSTSCGHGTP